MNINRGITIMYQTIEGFLQSWTYEAASTQKMLDALTDASLSQEIAPEHWTLGRVAWHIVTAIPVILSEAAHEKRESVSR